jgi:hypothetical protein
VGGVAARGQRGAQHVHGEGQEVGPQLGGHGDQHRARVVAQPLQPQLEQVGDHLQGARQLRAEERLGQQLEHLDQRQRHRGAHGLAGNHLGAKLGHDAGGEQAQDLGARGRRRRRKGGARLRLRRGLRGPLVAVVRHRGVLLAGAVLVGGRARGRGGGGGRVGVVLGAGV